MSEFGPELSSELEDLERQDRRRTLPDAPPGGVDFTSSDYLGLARRPELAEASARAAHEHGTGGRSSRLLGGGSPEHTALEREAAAWLGTEASLLFPSGYQANLGLFGALLRRGDALLTDELVHASIVDAARLSRAHRMPFAHLDLDELERNLVRAAGARRRVVAVESVFSMDGDLAPLAELDALCARHDAWLVVDEAHAAGVLGAEGTGACADHELEHLVARVITGGKALGVAGALVAGSQSLVDLLVNRARTFLFTTAPPPSTAAALRAAIELVRGADAERARVLTASHSIAESLSLPTPAAGIVPFVIGADGKAVELAGDLARRGLDVRAVRPPTVPEGSARLRIVCHATNTDAEVEELVRALRPAPATVTPVGAPQLAPCLFVTGTDTGVGKTVVSALLVRAARRLGPARYWKPVQTGDESDTDEVARLAGLDASLLLPPAFAFPLPASPHEAAREAGREIPAGALASSLRGVRRMLTDEHVIAELAGGLLVPLRDDGMTQLDWLAHETPPLVLVARSGLGTLNHTLLSLEALRARYLEPRALFLVGSPHASNRATLGALAHVQRVFEVPQMEELDPQALDRWLDANSLEELFR